MTHWKLYIVLIHRKLVDKQWLNFITKGGCILMLHIVVSVIFHIWFLHLPWRIFRTHFVWFCVLFEVRFCIRESISSLDLSRNLSLVLGRLLVFSVHISVACTDSISIWATVANRSASSNISSLWSAGDFWEVFWWDRTHLQCKLLWGSLYI